jgi:hypothetical protein
MAVITFCSMVASTPSVLRAPMIATARVWDAIPAADTMATSMTMRPAVLHECMDT